MELSADQKGCSQQPGSVSRVTGGAGGSSVGVGGADVARCVGEGTGLAVSVGNTSGGGFCAVDEEVQAVKSSAANMTRPATALNVRLISFVLNMCMGSS
jgi:hypothetical protein